MCPINFHTTVVFEQLFSTKSPEDTSAVRELKSLYYSQRYETTRVNVLFSTFERRKKVELHTPVCDLCLEMYVSQVKVVPWSTIHPHLFRLHIVLYTLTEIDNRDFFVLFSFPFYL